jgi:hypothetical protein
MAKTILIYGDPGRGKSAQIGLVAALAQENGAAVMVTSPSPDGLASADSLYGTSLASQTKAISSFTAITTILERKIEERRKGAASNPTPKPAMIVIDDVSVLFAQLQESLSARADVWVQVAASWGKFTRLIQDANAVGIDILMTAHASPPKHIKAQNARDGTNAQDYLGGPQTAGKQSNALAAVCSVVLHLRPLEDVDGFPFARLLNPKDNGAVFACGDDPDWLSRDRKHSFARLSPPCLAPLVPDVTRAETLSPVEQQVYDVTAAHAPWKTGADLGKYADAVFAVVGGLPGTAQRRAVALGAGAAWRDRPLSPREALGW